MLVAINSVNPAVLDTLVAHTRDLYLYLLKRIIKLTGSPSPIVSAKPNAVQLNFDSKPS